MKDVSDIAGYETNLLFDTMVAEFHSLTQDDNDLSELGRDVEQLGAGETSQGVWIGAYSCPTEDCLDLASLKTHRGGHGEVRLATVAVISDQPGTLEIKLDATKLVDAAGNRVDLNVGDARLSVQVGPSGAGSFHTAPDATQQRPTSQGSSYSGPVDLTGDGRATHADAMEASITWMLQRESSTPCDDLADTSQDVNRDGCIDVADLQTIVANYRPDKGTGGVGSAEEVGARGSGERLDYITQVASSLVDWLGTREALAAENRTFTVNSTTDDTDVATNGVCETKNEVCTLRAAIQEANAQIGPDTITFNIPGSGLQTIQLSSRLPTLSDSSPTTIDGYTQPGSAPNTDPLVSKAKIGVQVAGTTAQNFDALFITSASNHVRGLAFYRLRSAIILYGSGAQGNRMVGNFLGTDAAGSFGSDAISGAQGVKAEKGATGNYIGGTSPAERNVISGNGQNGIATYDEATTANVLVNNLIGLNPAGNSRLPNRRHGIDINNQSGYNVIGGSGSGERNVVSGNSADGAELSHGVHVTKNKVIGNFIGTDVTGNSATAYSYNGEVGVKAEDEVRNNTVADNVIGNNNKGGVRIDGFRAERNHFYNNRIGVSLNGSAIPNGSYGVQIDYHASKSKIGPDNIIANNPVGIRVLGDDVDFHTITHNSISGNSGLGIDLEPLGVVNANDAGDTDIGPNEQLNFPELASASPESVTGTACASCTVEIFVADEGAKAYGEGKSFVGSSTTKSDGTFTVAVSGVVTGDYVTLTATDAVVNTSEFSLNRVVDKSSAPAAPSSLAATAASSSQSNLQWADNATNERNYTVERSADGTTGWTTVTSTLAADTMSYSDTGLSADTTYYYRVKAINSGGSSDYSNTANATTNASTSLAFSDTWAGSNGATWDNSKWTTDSGGASARLDTQSDQGRMRFENVSAARARAIATMPKRADTEILMSFRFPSTEARGFLQVFSRATGDWVSGYPNSAYYVEMPNDGSNVGLRKVSAGTITQLSNKAVGQVTTEKQWMRFRVEGSALKVKVWTDGTPEPATWEMEVADAGFSEPGVLQLRWARSSMATDAREVYLDDLTVTDWADKRLDWVRKDIWGHTARWLRRRRHTAAGKLPIPAGATVAYDLTTKQATFALSSGLKVRIPTRQPARARPAGQGRGRQLARGEQGLVFQHTTVLRSRSVTDG